LSELKYVLHKNVVRLCASEAHYVMSTSCPCRIEFVAISGKQHRDNYY